jgi:hypothetical protein
MNTHDFAETLRQIESLPDTDGGGTSIPQQERSERIEFCYKRRDMLEELLAKTEVAISDIRNDIKRLTKEEEQELVEGPKPSLRRRSTDVMLGRSQVSFF